MEVILLQNVENLGEVNDLVTVKPGYGRNYLIPKGFAKVANKSNKKAVEEIKRQQQHKAAKILEAAKEEAGKLANTTIKVGAKVGKDDKIFGTVTTLQLSDAIKSQTGVEVDRKKIHILGDVKALGTFKAKAEIHREIEQEFDFEVVAE